MPRTSARTPLSLGCAVYHSDERRLRRALDSVLAQTFGDFQVIICDNSTDDATRGLCREYEDADPRVRYLHNDVNLGAYPSFWRTLHIADSPYFKWVADDDVLAPTYLARCVETLEDDPSLALCYTRLTARDPQGAPVAVPTPGIEARQDAPEERFLAVLNHPWQAHGFYGVFRTRHLRRTHPLSHDCVRLADILLLAEISLAGKIRQIPETLFTYTQRPKPWDDREKLNALQYAACFPLNPHRGITFPNCAFAHELLEAVRYADLPLEGKERLYREVPALIRQRISGLWQAEIRRAIWLVLHHHVLHEWGEPTEGIEQDGRWRELPGVHRFHASELLRRLESVALVWPEYPEPGVHCARAVLLVMLERVVEAHAALHVELARFPDYAPARQMLDNLEAASRRAG